MNDLSRVSIFNGNRDMNNYDFDFENVPMVADVSSWHEEKYANVVYIYNLKSKKWIDIELDVSQFDMTDKFKYQAFKYKGISYLFGINHYKEEHAEGILYQVSRNSAHVLVSYCTKTSGFDWRNEENILEFDQKNDEVGKPTGIMTWDFYHEVGEVLTIKIAKNCGGSYYANITNSKGEVVAKMSHSYW